MFDNVVYLNRDQDTDRRDVTEAQLIRHGITPVRYSALESTLQERVHEPIETLKMSFAQTSCLVSHLEIIRVYGDRELLVFEDDVDLSPSDYWGASFQDILSQIDESIGIVQLYVHPTTSPIRPRWWSPGTFGTVAYFIRPWYSKVLVEKGYSNGKWTVGAFPTKYVQPVADSVLYSATPTVSVTLFGLRNVPSNILPQATYVEAASKFGQSWAQGVEDIDQVKAALSTFKAKL